MNEFSQQFETWPQKKQKQKSMFNEIEQRGLLSAAVKNEAASEIKSAREKKDISIGGESGAPDHVYMRNEDSDGKVSTDPPSPPQIMRACAMAHTRAHSH